MRTLARLLDSCSVLKVSRADFLKSCGIALLGPRMYFQAETLDASPASALIPLETLTAALFRPHLDTEFAFRTAEGNRYSLVLKKVIERPISGNVAQFSLIFVGTAAMGANGNCLMQHPALGSADIFVVPIGTPDNLHQKYQACFSFFVKDRGEGASHVL